MDSKPRTVHVPADVRTALAGSRTARVAFEGLAPSHKKAHVEWIEEAKRPETWERRAQETLERLASGSAVLPLIVASRGNHP